MTEPAAAKGRGCFFYGCLTAIALLLLTGVMFVVGVRYAMTWMVNHYTDGSPTPLPRVEVSQAQQRELQTRVTRFRDALQNQQSDFTLTLTADEINALIATDSEFKDFKDWLFVILAQDKIKGTVSLPLDRFNIKRLKGRYLNAGAAFKVALENGELNVALDSVEVRGRPVPSRFLAGIQVQNLAAGMTNDPPTAAAIRKLESIVVTNGLLSITIKPKAEAER